MATTQSSSTRYSPQDNRELAIKLTDACVDPSYVAELWAVYFRRFEEVLAAEGALAPPVTRWGRQLATTPAHANYAKANSQPPDRFLRELIAAARRGFSA